MQEITYEIIAYIKLKRPCILKQWHIGLTGDVKATKKAYQASNKIVCEYMKSWTCKNKTQAKNILKELAPLGCTICDRTPNSTIFVFLAVDKFIHKAWKILNKKRPTEKFFILK